MFNEELQQIKRCGNSFKPWLKRSSNLTLWIIFGAMQESFWPFLKFEIIDINQIKVTTELSHDKTNKMIFAPSEDSDQPGHPPSLISLRSALMGSPGWSESSLGAHIILLVWSQGGSNIYIFSLQYWSYVFGPTGLGKQWNRAVLSGSTLFAIPSASFGCFTIVKPHFSDFLIINYSNCMGMFELFQFLPSKHWHGRAVFQS